MKEIDAAGIPAAHVCTIVPIAMGVGANRIVPAISIPHPCGNPELPPEREKALRRQIAEKALAALQAEITVQTVFSR